MAFKGSNFQDNPTGLWTSQLQDQVDRAWSEIEKRNFSSDFVNKLKAERMSEDEINSLFASALDKR